MNTESPQERITRLESEKQDILAGRTLYHDNDRISRLRKIEDELSKAWAAKRRQKAGPLELRRRYE